ncbi:MAG TPA: protein rhiA [Thermoanaerobaculia bacterium]|nr:protein rhiA [Thermoanaerobaculia bacterium]
MANGFQYTVIFKNNSQNPGSASLYQQNPSFDNAGMPLAWMTKYAYPTTSVSFQWQIEYGFVWSQTGVLTPGIVVAASQYWPADLTTSNQVTLTYDAQHGAFTFANQTKASQPGSLNVVQDRTIPSNVASVGIGMAGSATYVVQAMANVNAVFTPHPEYWIAFGNYVEGEVIDVTTMNAPAQIQFPPNVYSMTAILNPDLSWTIEQTQIVNERYVAARSLDKAVRWG